MSDTLVAVHSGLFNCFRVFATLNVSRHQALWNLSLNMIMISMLQLKNTIVFFTNDN